MQRWAPLQIQCFAQSTLTKMTFYQEMLEKSDFSSKLHNVLDINKNYLQQHLSSLVTLNTIHHPAFVASSSLTQSTPSNI